MSAEAKPETEKEKSPDEGTGDKTLKKFSSVLTSVWTNGAENGADNEGEAGGHPSKAVESMGNGDVSLDDFASGASDDEAGDGKDDRESAASLNGDVGDNGKELGIKDVLPGQSLAPRKKNSEFHKLFPKLPSNEPLIEDHSCALSRDILTQGKLYISPHYLCFYSNILGWQVTETINLNQVVEVQAKSTFGVFPNGLTVVTLHQRHTFASLLSRDGVVDLVTKLWKSPLNKRVSENGGGRSDLGEDDDMADNSSFFDNDDSGSDTGGGGSKPAGKKWPVANLGPDTNKPTGLPDVDPKEKIVANETVNAPLGVVANLVFGKDTKWFRRFLAEVEKNKEVPTIESFKDDGGKEKRRFDYIKPLNSSVGPKQTKCVCTETIEDWNLKERVTVITETRTPDVPSGNAFTTMSRVNLAWGPNNTTKFRMSTWIDWTGKSWIKSAIEKGALDGQVSYGKSIVKEINATLASGKPAKAMKIKLPNEKESVEAESAAAEHVEVPGLLGSINWLYIAIALAVVVVILLVKLSRSKGPGGLNQQLRSVQEEYYLWEWIDGRMPGGSVSQKDLANADVKEAIRVMENRLDKLKATLSA